MKTPISADRAERSAAARATPNHLQAWRKHRGLTQAELGALVGSTASVISLLESGHRRLSPVWLRPLAAALDAPIGALLNHGPGEGDAEVLEAWAAIPAASRPQALAVLRSFVPTTKV